MIGLDTNVMVRYITQDDRQQSKIANDLIESGESFFINHVMLCELVWVLESCYATSKREISEILEKIFTTKQFVVENSEYAWKAYADYKNSPANYSDCLIGLINQTHSCDHTVTFDKATKSLATFKVLK